MASEQDIANAVAAHATFDAVASAMSRVWVLHRNHQDFNAAVVLNYIHRAQANPDGEHMVLLVDWDNENLTQQQRARLDRLLGEIAAHRLDLTVRQMVHWPRPF